MPCLVIGLGIQVIFQVDFLVPRFFVEIDVYCLSSLLIRLRRWLLAACAPLRFETQLWASCHADPADQGVPKCWRR